MTRPIQTSGQPDLFTPPVDPIAELRAAHRDARLAAHGLGFEACLANPTIRRALENVVHARHRAKEPA